MMEIAHPGMYIAAHLSEVASVADELPKEVLKTRS